MLATLPLAVRRILTHSAGLYVRALFAIGAAVAVFFVLSYSATFVSREQIASNLERANAQHSFGQTYAPWTGRAIPRFTVNDCAFLTFLLQDYPSRIAETVSARIPNFDLYAPGGATYPTVPSCLQLIASLDRPDHADPQARWYHRYLHGQRIFARLALALVSPDALGEITLTLNVLVLLSVLMPALWRLRARGSDFVRQAGFAAIAATLLLFDGLWLFGIYFSHGASDLVLSTFAAYAYYRGAAAAPERTFVVGVALFGVATAVFEYLTGGVPFGLALLLGIVALDGPADPTALMRRAWHGSVIFGLAILLTFAIKIALVALLVDATVLSDFASGLSARVGNTFVAALPPKEVEWVSSFGIDVSSLERHWILSVLYMLARLGYASFVIGYGSVILGIALIGTAVVATAVLFIKQAFRARDPVAQTRLAILLGSALAMPVWSVVFLNHTLLHAIWMVRPFGWYVALAGILVCWRAGSVQAERGSR